jgi:hypothetical protein
MRGTEYADIVCRSWHRAFLRMTYIESVQASLKTDFDFIDLYLRQ